MQKIVIILLININIIYTGCPILNNDLKYLPNNTFYRKMFQTKVVWFRGGHKMVSLV